MDPTTAIQSEDVPARSRRLRGWSLAMALALSILSALLLSYQLVRLFAGQSQESSSALKLTEDSAETSGLQFSFADQPAELPEIHFVDGDGRSLSLHDLRGRSILLNVWATWCVPCRKEMPALDRLQAKFSPAQFLVLTLSIDRQGLPAVRRFYQDLGLKSLGIYVDQSGAALNLVRAPGLPTTLFVDREGREIGRKIGPAEWDSPETVALLRKHMILPAGGQADGESR